MSQDIKLVGFNNLFFDYPVLHRTILDDWNLCTPSSIYKEVEFIISQRWSSVAPWEIKIPQIDLFKIWHYDNKAKRTSLKWLEFAMRWNNVQDLPYAVGSSLSDDQKDLTIEYCHNDIDATEEFYKRSNKHIELREFYSKHENLDLINASEVKMSKDIFGKHLSKQMGITYKELRQLRTYRSSVNISEVIFDYITFEDDNNNEVLDTFRSIKWINPNNYKDSPQFIKDNIEKSSISFERNYKNIKRKFGEGGLHSFGKPGVYESDDDHVLIDVDFASYYPHLCFKNGLHPQHIPKELFNRLYEGFYKERKKYPKSDPRNYVLKIILNGSYGLSKDIYSFLYDPKWQLQICINGQLLLIKLTEHIVKNCKKDVQIIFENTDGAMYRIHRSDIDNLESACKELEGICNIPLETQQCKKIIARDVNNYINIIDEDNIKFKGTFEIDRDYHKNHSKRIVPIALANYYVNNIPPKETILNWMEGENSSFADNYGIFDFCLGANLAKRNDGKLYAREYTIDGVKEEKLGKVTRYYVSNDGVELIKKLPPLEKNKLTATDKAPSNQTNIFELIEDVKVEAKDRETNIEAGYKCTVYNIADVKKYDINYDYYINEANKVIEAVN